MVCVCCVRCALILPCVCLQLVLFDVCFVCGMFVDKGVFCLRRQSVCSCVCWCLFLLHDVCFFCGVLCVRHAVAFFDRGLLCSWCVVSVTSFVCGVCCDH